MTEEQATETGVTETCRRCRRDRDTLYLAPAGGHFDPHFVCVAKNSCKKVARGVR